jgi:hypothetical protein
MANMISTNEKPVSLQCLTAPTYMKIRQRPLSARCEKLAVNCSAALFARRN